MKTLLNKKKTMDIGMRTLGTLAIPVAVTVILLIVCAAGGKTMIAGVSGFTSFLSYTAVIMITTMALSINLNSGRFDFSLGSMALLSCLIATQINVGGNAILTLVLCIFMGAVLGAVSGTIYVLLKIPPIITSLGVTLVYEGIFYSIAGGKLINMGDTLAPLYRLVTGSGGTASAVNWLFALILIVVVLAVIIFIFDFTNFGYKYKALREGQKVSVNTGIKEVPNAIVCYIICGALMGIVGFLNTGRSGILDGTTLSFGSIGVMFSAFLPMFIGGFIGRYSNDKLGYLLAGITISLLNSTFSAFNVVSSTQDIVSAVLLVAFLIYLNNEQFIKNIVTFKWLRERKRKDPPAPTAEAQA